MLTCLRAHNSYSVDEQITKYYGNLKCFSPIFGTFLTHYMFLGFITLLRMLTILSSNAVFSTFFLDFSNSCSSVILKDQVLQSFRVEGKVVFPEHKVYRFLFIPGYLFLWCSLHIEFIDSLYHSIIHILVTENPVFFSSHFILWVSVSITKYLSNLFNFSYTCKFS